MEIRRAYCSGLQGSAALTILRCERSGVNKTAAASGARDSFGFSARGIFTSVSFSAGEISSRYGTVKISGSYSGSKTKGCSDKEFAAIDFDKIHGVELPEKMAAYDSGGVYYHGQLLTKNELVQLAVTEGKMTTEEVEENETGAWGMAFERMIEDEAKAKYPWSSSRYSEDGKYVFTTDEDGKTEWNLVEDTEMGASLDEIAGWICSGIPNRNIERRYLEYLRKIDPDLYEAAQRIGKEVQTYDMLTAAYEAGTIGEVQHEYDLSLLAMLFGKSADDFCGQFAKAGKTGDFYDLLCSYRPYSADALDALHAEQEKRTGGIY